MPLSFLEYMQSWQRISKYLGKWIWVAVTVLCLRDLNFGDTSTWGNSLAGFLLARMVSCMIRCHSGRGDSKNTQWYVQNAWKLEFPHWQEIWERLGLAFTFYGVVWGGTPPSSCSWEKWYSAVQSVVCFWDFKYLGIIHITWENFNPNVHCSQKEPQLPSSCPLAQDCQRCGLSTVTPFCPCGRCC